MLFATMLKNVLIMGFAIAANAHFVERAMYARAGAPKALSHLQDIRNGLGANITDAQEAVLELGKDIAENFATDKVDELLDACVAAFSAEECNTILGGDGGESSDVEDSDVLAALEKRQPLCTCSTGRNFCRENGRCVHRNTSKCKYGSCTY